MPTVTAIRKVETRPLWSGIVASPDRSEPSGVSVALSSHGVMTSNGPRDRLAMLVPSPLPAPILGPSSGVSVEDTVIDRVHLFDPRSTRETPHTVLPRGMHPAGYLHTSPRRSTLTRSRSGVSVVSRIDPRSTLDARRSTRDRCLIPMIHAEGAIAKGAITCASLMKVSAITTSQVPLPTPERQSRHDYQSSYVDNGRRC